MAASLGQGSELGAGHAVECEWGPGLRYLLPSADVVVIVDVMSFSTAVDIATARGAIVYPCGPETDSAAYARRLGAQYARPGRTATEGYSLSPASLLAIPAGTRLVLPSPNGSALSLAAEGARTFCGCLRNASAVARAAARAGKRIAVIPAGERWPDGRLRPALEDLIGAGAIINGLRGGAFPGTLSPEAETAVLAFTHFQGQLLDVLMAIPSGRELLDRGFEEDVRLAAMLDASENAPHLDGRAYISQQTPNSLDRLSPAG